MSVTSRKAGTLVNYRDRDWIVLPTDDPDILKIKPLGGSEAEITGIYLPLGLPEDQVKDTQLSPPTIDDLGDFETAKMLFNASRLSFRNAAGPFRCMGKLSFKPRSYQVVPLVMALKQKVTRLLIADDVGIGKTIEALMILKEKMERGEVTRFAVICLPHLCEQWQKELEDKLDIQAEIIRSSTVGALERKLPDDRSVFYHAKAQIVSVDYVKTGTKSGIFLNDCPDMVIVDEAHTCARPEGASNAQQQRFHLIHRLAQDANRHMLFLTATPHSGKNAEFQSLLGWLKPEFEKLDFEKVTPQMRKEISNYFVLRKRENIKRWANEETPFPERNTEEIGYKLTPDYEDFYSEVLRFARGLTQASTNNTKKGHYWAALALLRGVMSSPAAGFEMLKAKSKKERAQISDGTDNPVLLNEETNTDAAETALFDEISLEEESLTDLQKLTQRIVELNGIEQDRKAAQALEIVKKWIKAGQYPIIFCRYIATANYLATELKKHLGKKVDVQAITSELADEQRKERIEEMGLSKQRVLVATDCLSEGINLQQHFTAVLHYDLPWNPNRLEQREGRVDRYGQPAKEIFTYLLWGEDNPIDAVVLKVLIRKVRDIQKATGVSITLGDDNRSIMDTVLQEVLLDPNNALQQAKQISLDFGNESEVLNSMQTRISKELDAAKEKASKLRSIFAQESMSADHIIRELKVVDEAIGDMNAVESLVIQGCQHLGASITPTEDGYKLDTSNLPKHLLLTLPRVEILPISFVSPTPQGYIYMGRNHKFVEQLCQFLTALAFEAKGNQYRQVARSAVVQTEAVESKTTIVQFRVRNVIRELKRNHEIIAEEMYLWGYAGEKDHVLSYDQCKQLLLHAESAANLSEERQNTLYADVDQTDEHINDKVHALAEERAEELVAAHGRFQSLVGGSNYKAVHPVLPPDVLGIYVLVPKPKSLI
jgi:superfamily II DNA/RNA helicase